MPTQQPERSKGFIWFDRPEEGRKGFLSGLGSMMQGVAAPYIGDYQWGSRFAAQQNAEAERMFAQWNEQQRAQRQAEEDKIAMMKMGYLPATPQDMQSQALLAQSKGGWGQPYVQPPITLGGEAYQYSPELFQRQIAAQMAPILAMQGGAMPQGLGVTGMTLSPSGKPSIQLGQTSEAKAQEQALIAQTKERETAIGKADRLNVVGENIKNQWLKTSPYKGTITKTGLVPVLGMWDIIKKGIGATSAQQQDQVYASFLGGVRAQLARGMGDVGNLSEYEQKAVMDLVPNLMDSYESGIKKIENLAGLVETIRSTRDKQGYTNFTVDGKNYRIPKDKVKSFMEAKGL